MIDPQPEPPTNVRIIAAGCDPIPVECIYRGFEDGYHVWFATMPVTVASFEGLQIQADVVPARTAIGIRLVTPCPDWWSF